MNARKKYSAGTMAALGIFSGGTCYWGESPACGEQVVRFVKDKPIPKLEVAHIRAVEPGGPRYDDGPPMSDTERNCWTNLIFLCHPHHVTVDKYEPENYSVETLHQWKDRREKGKMSELNGLRNVTEERLQEMIEDALEEQTEKIEAALSRLGMIDVEAAEILRRMVNELEDMRYVGPFSLDPDIVGLLYESANKINLDPDMVSLLSGAADNLKNTPVNLDMVEKLNAAARELSGIVTDLQNALEQWRRYGKGFM